MFDEKFFNSDPVILQIMSGHPIDPRFRIPFGSALFQFCPEFNRAFSCNIANTKFAFVPSAKAEWFTRYWHTNVHTDHACAGLFYYISCIATILCKYRGG